MNSMEAGSLFEVRTPLFDGPIDLLLHLVKSNELPIEKLSLAEVADQYLKCLEAMRDYDLEVAGEYLVVAATLVAFKSSILLKEPMEIEIGEGGEAYDPYEELLQKLREAAIYKDAADALGDKKYLGIDVFDSPPALKYVEAGPVRYKQHDPFLLGKAFRKLLHGIKDDISMSFTMDSVSITQRMVKVLEALDKRVAGASFGDLVPDKTSKASIVGTFVALLELCKRGAIRVVQEETFNEILIYRSEMHIQTSDLTSEFDSAEENESTGVANA